jgi:hypothetical protein
MVVLKWTCPKWHFGQSWTREFLKKKLILWFRKPLFFVVIWWIFNGSMISWQVKKTSMESNMEKMISNAPLNLASGIKNKEPTYFQFWYKINKSAFCNSRKYKSHVSSRWDYMAKSNKWVHAEVNLHKLRKR